MFLSNFVQHTLNRKAPRDEGIGDARSRMSAGTHEKQVAVTGMTVVRPKISQLEQIVTQTMGGTIDQVLVLFP
jgi:hypothetical protein